MSEDLFDYALSKVVGVSPSFFNQIGPHTAFKGKIWKHKFKGHGLIINHVNQKIGRGRPQSPFGFLSYLQGHKSYKKSSPTQPPARYPEAEGNRASLVISFFWDHFCPTISLPILFMERGKGGKDCRKQQWENLCKCKPPVTGDTTFFYER